MRNKKKRKKLIIILVGVLIVLLVVLVFLCKKISSEQKGVSLSIGENLEITRIDSFSGGFMEDGTDEKVSDVMMIVIKNNGDQTLQYAELQLIKGEEIAEFSFSTLRPGRKMVVLEKNRKRCIKKVEEVEIKLNNVVFFNEELSLCEDTFSIEKLEGALNIRNITDKDIEGQIAVYYKSVKDNEYYGGITYRVVIQEGIKAGETQQIMTNHFSPDNSEIMFVTYVH